MADDTDDKGKPYKVGYGKPPKEHRFRRGKPQNFKRKRKRPRSREETIICLALEEIVVVENGRKRKMSAHEAILRQIRNRALNGDVRAQRMWLDFVDKALAFVEAKTVQDEAEADEAGKVLRAKIDQMAERYRDQVAAERAAALQSKPQGDTPPAADDRPSSE